MKLEIDHLVKKYGEHCAISIDKLSVSNASTLVIIGPSGGGKSTLLKIIAGLVYPDSGRIMINNQTLIFEEKLLRQYRKKIAMVFQSYNLFPHLTALENIILPLKYVKKLPTNEAKEISINLLKRFSLDKHAEKKPYALSGGQVQRVALIRAIAMQPQLLLLDEPTSALDPLMTSEVLDLILELKNEKRDIIMASHHLHFAKRIADQVLFISEGKLLEHGNPEKIFENPQSQQAQDYMSKVLAY